MVLFLLSKYRLEDQAQTRSPWSIDRWEVAAGVKSGYVRKDDRIGKLAKTARKLLTQSEGEAVRKGKGRSDESADLSLGGTYVEWETGKFWPSSFAPLQGFRISLTTAPENIGPFNHDFDRPGRAMDDYVIGLLGCSVLDGTSLTKGTRRYGRYVMEGSQTSSPPFVCACATHICV